ncbi:MAG: hypothetical protein MK293_12950, partial [Pedosphaera sp.]|nr:hypothetical protein [Pedosphaera sp.]
IDLGSKALGTVEIWAGRSTELIVLREEVKNENGTALFAIIRRMRRAFVTVQAVQDGIAHRARILSPVGLIRTDVVGFFARQAVVAKLDRGLCHVGCPRPSQQRNGSHGCRHNPNVF